MKEERLMRIHRIYSIVLSVVIAIAGICFMIACGCIYYSGGQRDQVYTTEFIAKAFDYIAIPVYLCLAMVILGFVIEIFAPLQFTKGKPDKPYAWILKRLYATKDLENCEPDMRASITKLQMTRKKYIIIRSVLLTAGSIAFLVYALNGVHFDSADINGSMIKAVIILCICMVVPFIFSIISSYQSRKSMQLEIDLLKALPASGNKENMASDDTDRKEHIVQIALLVIGLGLVILGATTGGTPDVLTKAINICTECIGLG